MILLYPARSRWGTYRGCCSRRDGARTSGEDGELGRLHTLAIIPTSSVLKFIVHKQWIMLIQVKCMEFYNRDCGVSSLTLTLIVQLRSKLLVTVRDILQTATGAQGSYSCIHDPTHCSRDKHLARPHINKKKWKETIFLPCLICLLRKTSKFLDLRPTTPKHEMFYHFKSHLSM